MATSLNLRTGARYEITLQGSQRHTRIARILNVLPDVLVLQLDDGRRLTVPHAAVLSARLAADQAPRGSDPAPARTDAHPPPRTVAASAPPAAESFYFTYINEKGSDVSATWLLDLRTRLVKEFTADEIFSPLESSIAAALDVVARQLLENDYERHESAYEQAGQNIAVAASELDAAIGEGQQPPPYFRTLLRQLTYVMDTEHSRYLRSAVSSPDFVSLVSREHFYVQDDQTFLLTVSVGLPAGSAPVESVQLLLKHTPDLRAYGQMGFLQILRPGETRELVQRLKVSDLALGVGEVTVSLSLRFRRASGQIAESPSRTIVLVLEQAEIRKRRQPI